MDYNIEKDTYYKVVDKDSGEIISNGFIEKGNVISTIHTVVFYETEEEYLAVTA